MTNYVFLNGKIIPEDEAYFPISDLSIQRGYAIFDFFRTQNGEPFMIDEHLDRFHRSAKLMKLPLPIDITALKKAIYDLQSKRPWKESGFKILLTGGSSPNGISPGTPRLLITHQPISFPDESNFIDGIGLISHEYKRDIPEAKTTNYAMAISLDQKMKTFQATDVLYHFHGFLSETSRSNVFLVKGEKVVTPDADVLMGVTRQKVIGLARDVFEVEERKVKFDELRESNECFITGTTKKVMPVVRVDDSVIGKGKPGPVTRRIMKLFGEFEKGWPY